MSTEDVTMSLRRSSSSLLLALALTGGLAGMAQTGHAAGVPAPHRVHVTIENFAFAPATIKVKAGTTVVWTNEDSVAHTVTPTRGHWGSGNLDQGKSYAYTFKKPGTYTYYCAVHPSMTARVIVTAPAHK
jgi:plastocyanin